MYYTGIDLKKKSSYITPINSQSKIAAKLPNFKVNSLKPYPLLYFNFM